MHTLSSASRTCMASASAVEWTATVATPSSLQARSTRSAISPRLAMRILSNIASLALLDYHQRLAIFDRLAVLHEDGDDRAGAGGGDLVHGLHGFDDEDGLARGHPRADLDEGWSARLRRAIGGADHRRRDGSGMDDRLFGPRRRTIAGRRSSGRLSRLARGAVGGERRREVDPAGDPDPLPVLLDFDLGQARFLQQIGELADQLLVEGARLGFGSWRLLVSHQLGLLPAISPASASMASS